MLLYQIDVNLSQILANLVEDIEILTLDLQVETNISADLWVKSDKDLLIQIIQSLISNAIKYNVSSGWLRINCQHKNNLVYLTVTNSFKDISPQDKERLFERFYRGDLSHSPN
ncbi:sensor histidine kinase [Trichormus azollae]|uniref:sensor histidine kinase n=1 Tax=Trichormus azollae TaxID=1164 RepID=UPI00325E7629